MNLYKIGENLVLRSGKNELWIVKESSGILCMPGNDIKCVFYFLDNKIGLRDSHCVKKVIRCSRI